MHTWTLRNTLEHLETHLDTLRHKTQPFCTGAFTGELGFTRVHTQIAWRLGLGRSGAGQGRSTEDHILPGGRWSKRLGRFTPTPWWEGQTAAYKACPVGMNTCAIRL